MAIIFSTGDNTHVTKLNKTKWTDPASEAVVLIGDIGVDLAVDTAAAPTALTGGEATVAESAPLAGTYVIWEMSTGEYGTLVAPR